MIYPLCSQIRPSTYYMFWLLYFSILEVHFFLKCALSLCIVFYSLYIFSCLSFLSTWSKQFKKKSGSDNSSIWNMHGTIFVVYDFWLFLFVLRFSCFLICLVIFDCWLAIHCSWKIICEGSRDLGWICLFMRWAISWNISE